MSFNKKVLGLILARRHSARLKDKHLIVINGKPLIQYTFEYAKKSPILDDIVCSTDSKKIADLAKFFKIVVIRRPPELARDDSHIADAIEHALLRYKADNGFLPDATVILYGNVPCRGSTIKEGIQLFYEKGADAVFTACKVSKYHPAWMFKSDGNSRIIFDNKSLNYRCQDLPDYYIATDSFIILKTERFLKRPPIRTTLYSDFGDKIFFVEETKNATVDIDDIHDLNYFRVLSSSKNRDADLTYWNTKRGR